MSYPLNYPTQQNANVQIFYSGGAVTTNRQTWVKPQGASFVWFTVIGGGGAGGDNSGIPTGGGSSAVTNFMCPAFLIPDELNVVVGRGGVSGGAGTNSKIVYQQKDGTGYTLLEANAGGGGQNTIGPGGNASSGNFFTAMGFFQSIAGDTAGGPVSPSSTTFLGAGTRQGNYGYANYGYFQFQPIIVGSSGGVISSTPKGGIGCGGAPTSGTASLGGDGVVVIITW